MSCTSCGAPIFWRRNVTTAKAIPVDRAPDPTGGVVLVGDTQCRFLSKAEKEAGVEVTRYASHFATCVNRDQHRKPKATR